MNKHILSLFVLTIIPFAAQAYSDSEIVEGTIEPDVWYIDTEVVVNGNNLEGPMPSRSKVCFAPEVKKDDLRCFSAGHPNIVKWTTSNLTFVPPKNAPPAGILVLIHPYIDSNCTSLYGEQSCDGIEKREEIIIGTYKAHPYIVDVQDKETGKTAHNLQAGRTYVITGYRFGDFGFGLYLGNWLMSKNDIVSWTHDTITFTPSEVPEKANELRVHNGGGKGNAWKLTEKDDMSSVPDVEETSTGSSLQGSVLGNPDEVPLDVSSDDGSIFADVPSDHPYYSAITWATSVGVVSGYENNTFRPERAVSRAEFLKMLMATNTSITIEDAEDALFEDVRPREWYAGYVREAVARKLASGYSDGTFRPNASVTLAEALKMMYRFYHIPTVDPQGDEWYARYLEHAIENDILFSNTLNPNEELSRKDTVWAILQLLQWKMSAETCTEDSSDSSAQ